jgi:hypothetical protein
MRTRGFAGTLYDSSCVAIGAFVCAFLAELDLAQSAPTSPLTLRTRSEEDPEKPDRLVERYRYLASDYTVSCSRVCVQP